MDDLDINEPSSSTSFAPAPAPRALPPQTSALLGEKTMFDPNAVFFFPLPRDENGLVELTEGNRRGPRPRDLVDVLKVEGWNGSGSTGGGGFWKTETEYVHLSFR